MNEQTLYYKLKMAYSEKNLNEITSRIIDLYRNNQFEILLQLGKKIKDFITADGLHVSRLFNRLITLYHPDKLSHYLLELEKYQDQPDNQNLNRFTHILLIREALVKQSTDRHFDVIDFHDLYCSQVHYGFDEEEFDTIINPDEEVFIEDSGNSESGFDSSFTDFISVIQREEHLDFRQHSMEFCLTQLNGELNLANRNIADLTGIESCVNIASLDLSHNHLININRIGHLHLLESLYLAGNAISDIAVLQQLRNLREIDLSYNDIEDTRPLFELPQLQYLNILGNPIPENQISQLKQKGILVIY
jgi:hypothetical protein